MNPKEMAELLAKQRVVGEVKTTLTLPQSAIMDAIRKYVEAMGFHAKDIQFDMQQHTTGIGQMERTETVFSGARVEVELLRK